MSYTTSEVIKKLNEKKEMEAEYKYQCWLESIEYFELTRGR